MADYYAFHVCPRMLCLQQKLVSLRLKYRVSSERVWDDRRSSFHVYHGIAEALRSRCKINKILLVQLIGSDGSSNHAVAIVTTYHAQGSYSNISWPMPATYIPTQSRNQRWYIIDSNEPYAVELSDSALARANASRRCVGWQYILHLEAYAKLVDSAVRRGHAKI